jgi:transcriptional regulator with XRE-family HTH domain
VSKLNLKEQSRSLRKQGFSLNEIVKKLDVSKSTLSLWCRDIVLNKSQVVSLEKRAQIKNYAGALKGAYANHLKSQFIINKEKEKAQEFIKKISNREICLIGTALYWAEGNKTGKTFGVVNSDPAVILICMKWLSIEFNMKIESYLPRLFINEDHKNRELEIKKYWSNTTKIPISQFRNTVFVKSKHKKIFPSPLSYIGVMHLRVKKSSQILYRTLAQVQIIKNI